MTTISLQTETSTPTHFRVKIRAGKQAIGSTEPTSYLAEARTHLERIQHAYLDSTLQALDGDSWRDVTADDVDRIAAVNTAHVLAALYAEDVPRLSWRIPEYVPGLLEGTAGSREAIEAYAALLGAQVEEKDRPKYTSLRVDGEYQGVRVEISCHIEKTEPVAE